MAGKGGPAGTGLFAVEATECFGYRAVTDAPCALSSCPVPSMHDHTATLLIRCPDRTGIIGSTTSFFHRHGANITTLDQHSTDPQGGTFFMRMEFQTPQLDVPLSELVEAFDEKIARKFRMDYRVAYSGVRPRTAIFVSRHDHAILELLWRWQRGHLPTDIAMVISNHDDLRGAVEAFGIPYHHVPNKRANKQDAEAEMLRLLGDKIDLVVLARYMQILSPEFVAHFQHRIINIHHSFLPAFVGADPYRQAAEKGVKLVGATAHYVTAELDAGPIIEQEVARVSHRLNVEELKEIGRGVERQALARAVVWHLENRIIIDGNKTVVFAGLSQ